MLKNSLITKKIYFVVRKVYYDIFWGTFLMRCHEKKKIILYEGYGKLKGHTLIKSIGAMTLIISFLDMQYIEN